MFIDEINLDDLYIYFDMAGVIANFDKGVIDLLHMQPINQADPFDYKKTNALYAKMRTVDHYYDKLEPIPETIKLIEELYAIYGDHIQILSAIPKPSRRIVTARADKIHWLKRKISVDIKANICLRAEKAQYFSSKSHILIDDFIKNVNECEAAGGTGILFTSADDVRRILKEMGIL